MSRFSDAVAIQDGACNPIAIANSLQRGIEEIRTEVGGLLPTDAILKDPALRLMVHHMAYLFRAHDCFDQIGGEYSALMDVCGQKDRGNNHERK